MGHIGASKLTKTACEGKVSKPVSRDIHDLRPNVLPSTFLLYLKLL
jgi:hypothetical protein